MAETVPRRRFVSDPAPGTTLTEGYARGGSTARQAVVGFLTDLARTARGAHPSACSCELTVLPPEWTGRLTVTEEGGDSSLLKAGDEYATALGNVQRAIAEGPYVDALTGAVPVVVPEIGNEPARWPVFAVTAPAHGLVGVHVEPLITAPHTVLGVAAWYTKRPRLELDPAARLPSITAALVLVRRLLRMRADAETAGAALAARSVIDEAVSILMDRHNCAADAAFDLLHEESLTYGGKLHAAAAVLVDRSRRRSD
jgi:hypothetical protein